MLFNVSKGNMLEFIVEIKRFLTLDSPKNKKKELAYDMYILKTSFSKYNV